MYTSMASELIPDNSLDYIYIDARHDYCGVMDDLEMFWPKLKSGAIVAGHDYLTAAEVPGQDWSICSDGSKNEGAVKGAVNDFFSRHHLKIERVTKGTHFLLKTRILANLVYSKTLNVE